MDALPIAEERIAPGPMPYGASYVRIAVGDADIIVAGGQESMSMAPHAAHLRQGVKMGGYEMVDTMMKDGLIDAFNGYHMGVTAENVARKWQITRDEQDAFAVASQNKAEEAQKAGRFKDEIVPVTVRHRKGETVVEDDEYIRAGTTLDKVAAQCRDRSGTDLLTAYIAGMEAAARLGSVARGELNQVGFHPTGVIAAFACALVAGKLEGLTIVTRDPRFEVYGVPILTA